MKKLILLSAVMGLFMSLNLQTALARSTALTAVVETEASRALLSSELGTKFLSETLGLKLTTVQKMTPAQRHEALVKEAQRQASNNNSELLKTVQSAYAKVNSGQKDYSLVLAPKNAVASSASIKGLLVKGQQSPQLKLSYPNVIKAQSSLQARIASGEVSATEAQQFLQNAQRMSQKLGADALGSKVGQCMSKYGVTAISKLMSLTSAWNISASANILGAQGAYRALVNKSKELYKDSAKEAENRICFLSGRGSECTLYGQPILANCK